MPHFLNPLLMCSSDNTLHQTPGLAISAENSDLVNLLLVNRKRLKSSLPQVSLRDLKTATSNGCNKSVVWGSSFKMVTLLSLASLMWPYHTWDRWPSKISNRGSIMPS